MFTAQPGEIRTWTAVQYITGWVECESIDDLPPKMQDTIMKAVKKLADDVMLPLKVVHVSCDEDIDKSTDETPVYFLRIVVSEIVARVKQQPIRRLN